MYKLIAFLFVSSLLFSACDTAQDACADFSLNESDITDPEAYLIIDAIIKTQFDDPTVTHIDQSTHFMTDAERFGRYFEDDQLQLTSTMKEDYIALNSSSYNWGDDFTAHQELIAQDELSCLFDKSGWNAFYSKYPDSAGYLKFGRPLVTAPNQALVTLEFLCGWECSSGYTTTLIKEEGTWKIQSFVNVWIS